MKRAWHSLVNGSTVHAISSAWVLKLECFVKLSGDEKLFLQATQENGDKRSEARVDIAHEGDQPRCVHLVCEGLAYRYKMLGDGRRQIVAFFLPGDICDLNMTLLKQQDHSIGTITPVRYAELAPAWFADVARDRPRVMRALEWEVLVNSAIQREWTLNLGQRTAIERLAHLFCELYCRLDSIGQARAGIVALPLTQMDLAEATGMTSVHVNRTLQQLRARDLIRWNGGKLEIPNFDALASVALFNADYLHLERDGQRFDANDR